MVIFEWNFHFPTVLLCRQSPSGRALGSAACQTKGGPSADYGRLQGARTTGYYRQGARCLGGSEVERRTSVSFIHILEAHYVVLSQIAARLHFY